MRTELRFGSTDNDTIVRTELAAPLVGVRRGRSLEPGHGVHRSPHPSAADRSEPVVEIADDRVRGNGAGSRIGVLSQWRKIEAELGPAGSE